MNKKADLPGKKFLFDLNDFGEEALRAKAAMSRRPTFSQDEMSAQRQTGYEEGRIAGLTEAVNSQESQTRDLVQQIVISVERLAGDEADRLATFIDQASLIAVQALVRTLPTLLDVLAVEQIAGFVTRVLEGQAKSQSIVIHIPAAREAAISERLNAALTAMRRQQNWSILPDPTLHDLQCRVEWSGGGAEWNPNLVAASLLETIMSHLPDHMKPAVMSPVVDEAEQTPHTEQAKSDQDGDA